MRVVISQPTFFPWVGTFEKIRIADIYVHLDDVSFSKGGFTNRSLIKTPEGPRWLTVPVQGLHLGQRINEVRVDNRQDWRRRHIDVLAHQYRKARFRSDMLGLVESVYSRSEWTLVSELSIGSIESVCAYFGLVPSRGFTRSSLIRASGAKSQKVLGIVKALGGTTYICGAGNQRVKDRYLDHGTFEDRGIRIEYMNYLKVPYGQLHGPFTPMVSVLDLIANEGQKGRAVFSSTAVHWRLKCESD
ncbi:MAG TPA: WbqC family protein [Pyrinomonadaceae bacterium]